jgi:hypothetical protein
MQRTVSNGGQNGLAASHPSQQQQHPHPHQRRFGPSAPSTSWKPVSRWQRTQLQQHPQQDDATAASMGATTELAVAIRNGATFPAAGATAVGAAAAAAAASNADIGAAGSTSSLLTFLLQSGRFTASSLLFIEDHHQASSFSGGGQHSQQPQQQPQQPQHQQQLFCCLCRCSLAGHHAAIGMHLTGRRHIHALRSVPHCSVELVLLQSSSSNNASAARRLQLGLLPVLNLPCLWKAVLVALRTEANAQQQQSIDSHAASTHHAGAGASSELMLGPLEFVNPTMLRLRWMQVNQRNNVQERTSGSAGEDTLHPLLHTSDLHAALHALGQQQQQQQQQPSSQRLVLVVSDWNKLAHAAQAKKLNVAKQQQQSQQSQQQQQEPQRQQQSHLPASAPSSMRSPSLSEASPSLSPPPLPLQPHPSVRPLLRAPTRSLGGNRGASSKRPSIASVTSVSGSSSGGSSSSGSGSERSASPLSGASTPLLAPSLLAPLSIVTVSSRSTIGAPAAQHDDSDDNGDSQQQWAVVRRNNKQNKNAASSKELTKAAATATGAASTARRERRAASRAVAWKPLRPSTPFRMQQAKATEGTSQSATATAKPRWQLARKPTPRVPSAEPPTESGQQVDEKEQQQDGHRADSHSRVLAPSPDAGSRSNADAATSFNESRATSSSSSSSSGSAPVASPSAQQLIGGSSQSSSKSAFSPTAQQRERAGATLEQQQQQPDQLFRSQSASTSPLLPSHGQPQPQLPQQQQKQDSGSGNGSSDSSKPALLILKASPVSRGCYLLEADGRTAVSSASPSAHTPLLPLVASSQQQQQPSHPARPARLHRSASPLRPPLPRSNGGSNADGSHVRRRAASASHIPVPYPSSSSSSSASPAPLSLTVLPSTLPLPPLGPPLLTRSRPSNVLHPKPRSPTAAVSVVAPPPLSVPVPLPSDTAAALSSAALAPLPLPVVTAEPCASISAALSAPLLSKQTASNGEPAGCAPHVSECAQQQPSLKQQQNPPPPSSSAATVEAPYAPQQLASSCASLPSFAQPPTAAAVAAMQGPSFGPFQFSFPRVLLQQF